MKAQSFFLIDVIRKQNAINAIQGLILDGKTKVTISDVGAKKPRQRGLQWIWYGDAANSGIGGEHEDTTNGVDLVSKYRWAIPILERDDELFSEIYCHFVKHYGADKVKMMQFVKDWVHTEKFSSSQMAEYLTNFQRYYVEKGVNLTDPQDKKLLEAGHGKK